MIMMMSVTVWHRAFILTQARRLMKQEFQPGQIVYLEEANTRLYAEVIQVVVSRQLCWVRPLLLQVNRDQDSQQIIDLREAFDILWSISLFRHALDVEVITLISQIFTEEPKARATPNFCKQQLREFMDRVWQIQRSSNLSKENSGVRSQNLE